jgi:hypothetical protein
VRLLLLGGLAEGVLNLGALLLGGSDVAQALVTELQGTLFLADTEKLGDALLKGGGADELSNDGLDGTELLLGEAKTGLLRDRAGTAGNLVTLVEASNDAGGGSLLTGSLALLCGHPSAQAFYFTDERESQQKTELTRSLSPKVY